MNGLREGRAQLTPPSFPPYLKLRRPHIHDVVRHAPHALDGPQEILMHLLHAHRDRAALDATDFHLRRDGRREEGRKGAIRGVK